MICFKCKSECGPLKSLVTHFKIYHSLGPDSSYDCCEGSCTQSFQYLSSFKRHVKIKHFNFPKNNSLLINSQTPNIQNEFFDVSSTNSIVIPSNDTPNDFNLQKAISTIHLSAVKFVLS